MADTSRQEEPWSNSTTLGGKGPLDSAEPAFENVAGAQEEAERLQEEDVQSLLAVSISRAQSRLASPRTPAAEKAAALEQLDGGGLFDDIARETQEEDFYEYVDTTGAQASPVDLPSPWRASPKEFEKTLTGNLDHKDLASTSHQRSSSGTLFSGTDNPFKRLMATPLPSLPKPGQFTNFFPNQIPFFTSNHASEKPAQINVRSKRSNSLFQSTNLPWNVFSAKADSQGPMNQTLSEYGAQSGITGNPHYGNGYTVDTLSRKRTSGSLHKASSDSSLRLSRDISRVSSLGDDAHFHDVQGQVNSRFKAIKDSFADSSFKLPNLPTRKTNSNSQKRPPPAVSNDTRAYTGPSNVSRNRRSTLANLAYTAENQPQSQLEMALENLTGDIVVLGGYRGSILRSAKAPHRQLWAPVKVGLGIRKVDLEVGLDDEAEKNVKNSIIADGMLTHIGPVDISRRLLKRLRHCENSRKGLLRVWNYGYDWRLSPHLLSQYLTNFLEKLPSNQSSVPPDQRGATIIAHSLGGLITRHAINRDPSLVRGVLYASVPQSCVNILGPLRNGDDVLLTSRVLTAQVNFTLRTSYALLPESGTCFFDKSTGEDYKVDFFDIDTWINHRLSPCVVSPFPPPDQPAAGLGSLIGSISNSLPSLSITVKRTGTSNSQESLNSSPVTRNGSTSTPPRNSSPSAGEEFHDKLTSPADTAEASGNVTIAPEMGSTPNMAAGHSKNSDHTPYPAISTLDIRDAILYLQRTLQEIAQFKRELHARQDLVDLNAYPPTALIYGKSIPTVKGARVASRDAIKYSSAFDDLIFGAGDGVVLAKEAMLPEGYKVARGGRVSSDRGHVTLLGDLEAVGRCLLALQNARRSK